MISFLQMSLWAAALTVTICALRAFFGKRLPRRTFRILWAVVILRMLVPLSLPVVKINTGMTVSSAINTAAVQDAAVCTYIDGEFTQVYNADHITPGTVYEVAETSGQRLSVSDIWLLTAIAVFAFFAAAHINFRLKVRDAVPAETDFEAGLKRRVRIKVSDRIDSPLTYGIFRPVILLPKNIYSCGEKTSAYILSHELTHIKRFDVLYKLFMVLAVSLHWFNPFAWVMLVFANRDIELSCDEEVIFTSGGAREEYAMTLIGMEERRSFGALLSGFGGSSVKERIKSVMTVKKVSHSEKAAAVLLVAMAFTVFTVYDIDNAAYSVTVSASESADVCCNYPTAVEDAYYSEYVIESSEDTTFTMEETDRAINSVEIAVMDAPAVLVEAEAAAGTYETSDTKATKMYAITTADGKVLREYPDGYSLYYYGYYDPYTGVFTTILLDMNEYSPYDYQKYGLTVSRDKGYCLYNGVPVGGFQCLDFTFVDSIAIQDGGSFFIYKEEGDGRFDETIENGMVQVNTKQFCDITGMRL